MTYDEAIAALHGMSRQYVTKPDNHFAEIAKAVEANHSLMIRRWKNWRNYAQSLWAACHEGGAKGMPADLFHRDDYKRMKNWQIECANADKETTNGVQNV